MHNGFEKQESVHGDAMFRSAFFGCNSDLDTIVHFYSEDIYLNIREKEREGQSHKFWVRLCCSKDSFDLRHGLKMQKISTTREKHLHKRSDIKLHSFMFQLTLCHVQEGMHELRGMRRLRRHEMQPSSAVWHVLLPTLT